jgi:hypothetical protein
MSQRAGSPLCKLVLVALSDWSDMSGAWVLNIPKLAAFAETNEDTVEDALSDLTAIGLVAVVGAAVQIAFAEDRPLPEASDRTPSWRISSAKRFAVYARDHHACVYCGSGEMLSLDHVIPRSKGGQDGPENLVTACQPCNSSKRDRDLTEWKGRPQ